MRASGQLFGVRFGEKSLLRECGVDGCGGTTAVLREEERGGLDFRAVEARAISQSSAMPASKLVSEEWRPLRGCMARRADPATRANAHHPSFLAHAIPARDSFLFPGERGSPLTIGRRNGSLRKSAA
jgi:hypothetical protein